MDGIGARLLRQSFANAVQLGVSVASGLALPPLVIFTLGIDAYGAWALIFAIAQALYIADLGMQPALAKYIAEFKVGNSYEKINAVATAALAVYAIGSTVIIAVLFTARQWVFPIVFRANPAELQTASTLLLFMIGVTMLNLFSGVFVAVLNGLQRMEVATNINTLGVALNFAASVILLVSGWKLWALGLASAATVIFTSVMLYVYTCRICPTFSISPANLRLTSTWQMVGNTFVLSTCPLMNRAVTAIVTPGVRIVLGAYAGLQAIAYQDLVTRIMGQLSTFPVYLNTPLVPAVAGLKAQGANESVNDVVRKSMRYMNILSLPLFAFAVTFAHPIITAWLGTGYDPVALGIQILGIGTYVNTLTSPGYHALIGLGKPGLGIQLGVLTLFLNVLLTAPLSLRYGFIGAILGQTTALVVSSIYFLARFHRELQIPIVSTLWQSAAKPSLLLVFISIPFFYLYRAGTTTLHWNTLAALLVGCGTYMFVFVLVSWRYGVVGRRDLELVRSALGR